LVVRPTSWPPNNGNANKATLNNAANGKTMIGVSRPAMPMMLANESICFGQSERDNVHRGKLALIKRASRNFGQLLDPQSDADK
jgi:hypothetical protein